MVYLHVVKLDFCSVQMMFETVSVWDTNCILKKGTIERENLNHCEEGSIVAMMIREFQIEGGDGSDRGRDLERVQ